MRAIERVRTWLTEHRRCRRWLVTVLLAPPAAELLYLIIANLLLRAGGIAWILPHFTHDVSIAPGKSYSLLPGVIELRDVKVQVHDSNVDMLIQVKRGEARVKLWRLASRHLDATRVRGEGVVVWFRSAAVALAGVAPPLAPPRKPPPVPTRSADLWGARLSNVLVETQDVWVGPLRVRGAMRVRGGFELQPLQHAEIDDASVRAPHASVSFGGRPFSPDLDVAVTAGLSRQKLLPGKAIAAAVSATVRARGAVSPAALSVLVPRASRPGVAGAPAFASVDVGVDHGVVRGGSYAELDADKLTVSRGKWSARGHVTAEMLCANEQLKLRATLQQAALANSAGSVATLRRGHIQATLTADLRAPRIDVLAGALHGLETRDPARLQRELPLLASTAGDVRADVSAASDWTHLAGAATLRFKRAAWRGHAFAARWDGRATLVARARAPFRHVELRHLKLSIDHAAIRRGDASASGFRASLASDRLVVSTRRPRVSGRVQVAWPDGTALRVAASVEPPPIIGGLFRLSDLHATADIDIRRDVQDVRLVKARTRDLNVRGRVRRCGLHTRAALLVRRGIVSFGMLVLPDDTSIVPLAGEDWLSAALHRLHAVC